MDRRTPGVVTPGRGGSACGVCARPEPHRRTVVSSQSARGTREPAGLGRMRLLRLTRLVPCVAEFDFRMQIHITAGDDCAWLSRYAGEGKQHLLIESEACRKRRCFRGRCSTIPTAWFLAGRPYLSVTTGLALVHKLPLPVSLLSLFRPSLPVVCSWGLLARLGDQVRLSDWTGPSRFHGAIRDSQTLGLQQRNGSPGSVPGLVTGASLHVETQE
jgi:hypothetical protein